VGPDKHDEGPTMYKCNDRANFPPALASCVRRLAASLGLASFCIATAWAGRGDIDPNYGASGGLTVGSSTVLALPGDRLVIGEKTEWGFRVRMVDAAGQYDPDFGEGGVVLIDSSDTAGVFQPEAAAFAPNGDLIFVGKQLDTASREILRLDSDGQPVISFGNREDGFVETALAAGQAMAFAIDPDGKIVLAEVTWISDYSCSSTAQLQRLLANGQPDTDFGGNGIIEIPNLDICNGVPVFGVRSDGSIIVGGDGHTITAVDAAGHIDQTFGVDGRLNVNELAWARVLLLPDGGLLISGSSDEAASANDIVLLKFDRTGQPDLDFGAGTGSVTVDVGADILGEPSALESVEQLALDPDGEHVVALMNIVHADGNIACSGIARLSIDGMPDAQFGRNGLTCLNFGFNLTAVQVDGAPLFFEGYNGAIHRLLPDNSPSPGLLRVVPAGISISESDRTATVTIERVAGRDGAVSANYATGYRPPSSGVGPDGDIYINAYSASAGVDYMATSGRLDWASGDDGQRTVTVRILNDRTREVPEWFGVNLSEPVGGVQLIAADSTIRIVDDGDESTVTPPPRTGGGGSVSWATLLPLLTLLLIRRRRDGHAAAR
jgi:uncharacterized delta-60 repeat protein